MNLLQFVSFATSIQLDYASKEKDDKTRNNEEMKVKEGGSDMDIYNFNYSELGGGWIIGTVVDKNEEWNYANAYKLGVKGCPENLIVPSHLTRYTETMPVEVVGHYAFARCGDRNHGKTKKVRVPKQVKYIMDHGFGYMADVVEFTIEDGSELEKIYYEGLQFVGYYVWPSQLEYRTTLTLPSSLNQVFPNGFNQCTMFEAVIYCGSHYLSDYCNLEYGDPGGAVVKVSPRYPANKTALGIAPDRDSYEEVEEHCIKMDHISFISVPVDDGCEVIGWGKGTELWCPYNMSIPEELNGSTVISIKDNAFANCTFKGPITLPSTLKRIGAYAFANCSAKGPITLPSALERIGAYAFENCTINGPITLPSALKEIGAYAFANLPGVTSIVCESKELEIGAYAFANLPGVTSIVCESIELEIGEGAFESIAQEADQPVNISLPKNTRVGKRAFASAKIGGVYVI